MPIAEAQGKEFNFPEGTTPEQMGVAIDEFFADEKYKTPAEIIEIMKNKHIEKHKEDGTWDKQQESLAGLKKAREAGAEDSGGADSPLGVPYPEEEINPDDVEF